MWGPSWSGAELVRGRDVQLSKKYLALFITQMETKWTKWYAMKSHVIAYRSLELLFNMHTFNFNCFFDDFNCAFTQIHCLSRVLMLGTLCYLLESRQSYKTSILTRLLAAIRHYRRYPRVTKLRPLSFICNFNYKTNEACKI